MHAPALRTVVLGGTSLVGWQLLRSRPTAVPVCSRHVRLSQCRDWPRADLEDAAGLQALLVELAPTVLVHAAGICDVDRCETDPAWAEAINVQGTRNVLAAWAALPRPCQLVYCSSDHVFGGGAEPYDEKSPPRPISVYGRTRVAAEALVRAACPSALIVRPGLVLGPSIDGRRGHLDWLRYRHARGLPISVVADEFRRPVAGRSMAELIWTLVDGRMDGIRHISGDELCSRVELVPRLATILDLPIVCNSLSRNDLDYPHLGRVDLRTCQDPSAVLSDWQSQVASSIV